jgi:hypothetical protein
MARSGVVRSLLVAMFVASLLLALVQAAPAASDGKKKPARKQVVLAGRATVLLDTNRIVSVSLEDGAVLARQRLGGAPAQTRFPGRYLARSLDGRLLYVLVNTAGKRPDEIALVDPATLETRRAWPLERDVTYRGLVVGPLSGRVFVYGNVAGKVADKQTKQREQSAVLTIVDPTRPKRAETMTVRKARGHDWWTYWGAISPNEKRLFLSYHGGCGPSAVALCTTGADWIDLNGKQPRRCKGAPPDANGAGVGCSADAHGMVEGYQGSLLATTGGSELLLADRPDAVGKRFGTKISDTHLMSFALDRKRDEVLLSSCGEAGGLSIVDLAGAKAKRVADDAPCASVLAYVPGKSLAALASRSSESGVESPVLTLLNVESGKTLRQKALGGEPLDLTLDVVR